MKGAHDLMWHSRTSKFFFLLNDTATTDIYTVRNTLSLHDALPISFVLGFLGRIHPIKGLRRLLEAMVQRSEEHTSELQSLRTISYAVFGLKKKMTEGAEVRVGLRLEPVIGQLAFIEIVRPRDVIVDQGDWLYSIIILLFHDTAAPFIYTVRNTLSLHDALPI